MQLDLFTKLSSIIFRFQVSWGSLPTAEAYLLQLHKYDASVGTHKIIEDDGDCVTISVILSIFAMTFYSVNNQH